MKKFEFRLDSALRWRDTQLQIERGKLSALLAEEAKLKGSLETLGSERRSALQCLAQEQLFSLDLRSLSSYLVGAETRATLLQNQIRKRRQLVVEQQRARRPCREEREASSQIAPKAPTRMEGRTRARNRGQRRRSVAGRKFPTIGSLFGAGGQTASKRNWACAAPTN